MSNSENTDKALGGLTSFYEMLTSIDRKKRFDEIIIPKIQRDYAQGRSGRELMRSRFLKRLFYAIDTDDSKAIKLDFVYGQAKNNIFYPIDGQQRLTTLFLLYLYIGKRSGVDVSALSGFTYDTRDSSKEFCKMLIEIPAKEYTGIRMYVQNQWWYTSRWSTDPTISSMVVMLDDIDKHYKDWDMESMKKIWNRLTLQGKIEFWNLRLDDLDTSDDLYIKMNSRGKPLTNFEHFKAEIESYLYDKNNEDQKKNAAVFSLKVDTVWTNLLWAYRDSNADSDPDHYAENGLDSMFINIFKHFMVIEGTKLGYTYKELEETYILSLSEKILKGNPDLLLERFTKIMDFFANLNNVRSFFTDILTHDSDEYRIELGISANSQNYRVYIQQNLDGTRDYFCRAATQSRLKIAEILLLEAFFHYAYRNSDNVIEDIHYLREKIRIIRNLILNSRDELRNDRMQALLLRVDKIMSGEPLDASASGEFRQGQVSQEITKINYINTHSAYEWDIKFAENHYVLCGNLACYIDENDEVLTAFLLKHEELFHAHADYDRIEKYLLTFGDYAPSINGRKLYGGRDRDNWRDDIFTNRNKISTPIILRALGESQDFADSTIDEVIMSWLSKKEKQADFTWPYYMVKHNGMRHGEWARYATSTDFITYDFIMMNKNNFNGKHWNPYLFCLCHKLKGNGAKIADYNAPLIFEKEEITVSANEANFDLILKDGSHFLIEVPQTERNGVMIDNVDRIEWAYTKILEIIDHSSNPIYSENE